MRRLSRGAARSFFWSWQLMLLALALLSTHPSHAQNFDLGPARPDYLLGFVAIDNHDPDRSDDYNLQFGNDSHKPHEPVAHSEFFILHPQLNTPLKIFPLPVHYSTGLIDADPSKGAVAEPNVTLDGNSVLLTYFHDVTRKRASSEGNRQSTEGSDIYKIDLSPLKADPNFPAESLNVTRLTFQPLDVNQHALNKHFADQMVYAWGKPFHMHAIEIETELGPRIIYVSDKRHVQNSNFGANNQFNIFIANQSVSGELIDENQFQYYTTTSAISPTNLRDGFAFSYHANTEGDLKWEFQQINSAGKWAPLQGYSHYGSGRIAFHNGTLCKTSDPRGDVWFGNAYYPGNNNGFGGIIGLEMSKATQNIRFTNNGRGYPAQNGSFNYTLDVEWDQDDPSLSPPLQSNGRWSRCDAARAANNECFGKFTTPRCGKEDQLFLAWSPTLANQRNLSSSWNVSSHPPVYDAKIVYRSDLWTPASASNPANWPLVVDETSNRYSLLWPTPIISHADRFDEGPRFSRNVTPLDNHLPVAQVGTSALYHTDVVPYECRYNSTYNPNQDEPGGITGNEKSRLYDGTASLSYLRDNNPAHRDSVCENPVLPADVFGVAINLTDNKSDVRRLSPVNSRKEKTRRLCVSKTADQVPGNTDHSFLANVPSNVPFEFHLLHRRYALRMADVRSWHSLKAGERRTDCGGCHQHGADRQPISFDDKLANQPEYQAENCLTQTSVIEYDASCTPQIVIKNTASEPVPMLGDNTPLFQGLQSNCSSCHSAGNSGANAFIVYSTAENGKGPAQRTYEALRAKNYVNRYDGALGSPAFWAARGERTDGRDNSQFPIGSKFRYSSVHDSLNLCAANDNWVYLFGLWIDNLMPNEFDYPYQTPDTDTFHPSLAFGLTDTENCSLEQGLMIGTWDESGSIQRLSVELNGNPALLLFNLQNGSHDASNLVPSSSSDLISVTAEDNSGNRQSYQARAEQLIYECLNPNSNSGSFGGVGATPTPTPPPGGPGAGGGNPTPTPSLNPSPTPSPGGGTGGESLEQQIQRLSNELNALLVSQGRLKKKISKLKKKKLLRKAQGRSFTTISRKIRDTRKALKQTKIQMEDLQQKIQALEQLLNNP